MSNENSVYHSSTHGDIPLSFTGKRFLANLRDAINTAIGLKDFNADDMAVSKARGEIAQYMSKLEGEIAQYMSKLEGNTPSFFSVDWGVAEARTLAYYMRKTPEWKSPQQQSCDELLEAAREYNEVVAKLNRCVEQAKHVGLKPSYVPNPQLSAHDYPRPFPRPFRKIDVTVEQTVTEMVPKTTTKVMGREP